MSIRSTPKSFSPAGACIAGIGGFGQAHHAALRILEDEGRLRLLATCDPRHSELSGDIATLQLRERHVDIFASFEEMLARRAAETKLVTIATPISVHASMHAACVRRKLACYLEKPPTLDPEELEGMIALDREAEFQTQVGFSYIVESWRHELKRRLLSGEFGPIEQASFLGFWQRTNSYYNRSSWAGKLMLHDELVLDSCFGNAMSHHVHDLLFFAGSEGIFSWADIEQVQAELYRANPIESADTVFTEAVTSTGIVLRVAMSHACSARSLSIERIVTEKAVIEIVPNQTLEIRHNSGKVELLPIGGRPVFDNIRYYVDYLDGKFERPLTTLADSRPLVTWNALLFIAAGRIHNIPERYRFLEKIHAMSSSAMVINDIEVTLRSFIEDGAFPSSAGVPWATHGGKASRDDLPNLRASITALTRHAPRVGLARSSALISA